MSAEVTQLRELQRAITAAKEAKQHARNLVAIVISLPFLLVTGAAQFYVLARILRTAAAWWLPFPISGRLVPIVALLVIGKFLKAWVTLVVKPKDDSKPKITASDCWAAECGAWAGLGLLYAILWTLHHFQ